MNKLTYNSFRSNSLTKNDCKHYYKHYDTDNCFKYIMLGCQQHIIVMTDRIFFLIASWCRYCTLFSAFWLTLRQYRKNTIHIQHRMNDHRIIFLC